MDDFLEAAITLPPSSSPVVAVSPHPIPALLALGFEVGVSLGCTCGYVTDDFLETAITQADVWYMYLQQCCNHSSLCSHSSEWGMRASHLWNSCLLLPQLALAHLDLHGLRDNSWCACTRGVITLVVLCVFCLPVCLSVCLQELICRLVLVDI